MTTEDQTHILSRQGFRAITIAAVTLVTAAIVIAPISASATTTAPTTTDGGSIGIQLLDVPADAVNDPRARQYIVDQLEPGTTIERRVQISNTTAGTLTIQAYSAAASITDGAFIGSEGRTANDLSSWTTLSEPELVVPANSTVIDTVTLSIPADAAPGEKYAAIWAEASNDSNSVQIVNRVGVRMYVSVGGDNAPGSSFDIESMTASRNDDGKAVVTAQLHNTGGRALDIAADLTLAAASGSLSAGPYPSTRGTTIAPGDTQEVVVTVPDDIDAEPWNASITVTSGVLSETFEAELTFPKAGKGDAVEASNAGGFPLWLTILLAIVVLLVVAAAALAALTIRKRRALALQKKNDELAAVDAG